MEKNSLDKMRRRDYWSYGAGVLGIAAISQMIAQLSYFYTDKVGMAAALAGTAIMITKIVDALTDLIMGQIVDSTRSKWGKARPWMLWMALPALLAVAGLLCMPQSLSESGKFIYAVVTNIFASAVVCTAISVPYACLLAYRTTDQNERTSMNIHRTICNFATGLFFSVAFIPVTNLLGGTQGAWIKVGIIIAVVAVAGMLLCFKTTPEMAVPVSEGKREELVPFFRGLRQLVTNRYWVIMALAQLVANIIYATASATNTYYARWIFGSENIIAVMGAIGFVPTLLGFFIVAPLVRRFGPHKVVRVSFAVGILGAIIRIAFPYSFVAVCIGGALVSASTMPFMMVGMVLIADVADFEEWRSGKAMVGMVNSASSFGAKVGSGIGSGLIGWILGIYGYASQAATQTASAIKGILVVANWMPGVLVAVMLLLMLVYDIDRKYPHFKEELRERREAAQNDA